MDRRTRILILGSLPGDASLRAGRYYAHPRNLFWQLAGTLIGRDLVALGYDDRLATLLRHGIGLWDVVRSGKREGSLDAALREVERNDLATVLQQAPELVAIGFNGATSARIGRRTLGPSPRFARANLALVDLPSSSPAHAAMPLAGKQRHWLALRPFLDQRQE